MDEKVINYDLLNAMVQKFLRLDCNAHKEKKNGFDYLSWVWGWTEVLKEDPSADFRPVLTNDGRDYWTDGKTARVIVDVTIHGFTKQMSLAIMDFRNQAIPLEKITEVDVNKSIMRCMVKCLAKFGLGLYIYAGEDLPIDSGEDLKKQDDQPKQADQQEVKNNPAKPSAEELAKPAPAVTKKTVKRQVNPRAAAAWKEFITLDSVPAEREERVKAWQNLLFNCVGVAEANKITDDAMWDKIDSEIDTLKCI